MLNVMYHSIFIIACIQCSYLDGNYHGTSGHSTLYSHEVYGRSRPHGAAEPVVSYEAHNNRLYYARKRLASDMYLPSTDYDCYTPRSKNSKRTHVPCNDSATYPIAGNSSSLATTNSSQNIQPLQLLPLLPMPQPHTAIHLPTPNIPVYYQTQMNEFPINANDIPPAVCVDNVPTAELDSDESIIDVVVISDSDDDILVIDGTEAAINTAVGNDDRCLLKDLERLLNQPPSDTVPQSSTYAILFTNILQSYSSSCRKLSYILSELLIRSVQWKRMDLVYFFNPEDATKTTLSRLHVTSNRCKSLDINNIFDWHITRIQHVWNYLYIYTSNLQTEMKDTAKAWAHDSSVQLIESNAVPNEGAPNGLPARVSGNPEARSQYIQVLMELTSLANLLPKKYAWITVRINLIYTHAVFLDSIIAKILGLIQELSTKYILLENVLLARMDKLKINPQINRRRIHQEAKDIYGCTSTLEWVKDRCERLLKLRYDLIKYNPGVADCYGTSTAFIKWRGLECKGTLVFTNGSH